jgi:hypothetical protein
MTYEKKLDKKLHTNISWVALQVKIILWVAMQKSLVTPALYDLTQQPLRSRTINQQYLITEVENSQPSKTITLQLQPKIQYLKTLKQYTP